MKLCLFCKHFDVTLGVPGYEAESSGETLISARAKKALGVPGYCGPESAGEIACARTHIRESDLRPIGRDEFLRVVQTAEVCPDFEAA
jgi:hypothetical protein